MTIHTARASLLSIIVLFSGCTVVNTAPHPATTQPAEFGIASDTDPQAAKSLERDLLILKQSRSDGLLTAAEYQRASVHVIAELAGWFSSTHNGMWHFLNATRLHAELAYLSQMKNQGTLTAEQYESARHQFVEVFSPVDAPQNSAQIYGGQPRSADQYAKDLDDQLTSLKASLADGVLTKNEYEQATYRAIYPGISNPIRLDELDASAKYLAGMKARGTLTSDQYDWLRKMLAQRFVPADSPTSQPAQ